MWKSNLRNNLNWNKLENVSFQRAVAADKIVHSNRILYSQEHFPR